MSRVDHFIAGLPTGRIERELSDLDRICRILGEAREALRASANLTTKEKSLIKNHVAILRAMCGVIHSDIEWSENTEAQFDALLNQKAEENPKDDE